MDAGTITYFGARKFPEVNFSFFRSRPSHNAEPGLSMYKSFLLKFGILALLCLEPCRGAAEPPLRGPLVPAAPELHEDRILRDAVLDSGLRLKSTKHFAIYHNESDLWAVALGVLLEDTHARFAARMTALGLTPETQEEPLVWICFSDRDAYLRYAQDADGMTSSGLDAYYSSVTNRVAFLRDDRGTSRRAPAKIDVDNSDPSALSPQTFGTVESSDAVARVTHEAVHHLSFGQGILDRNVVYPLWVTEGMAVHLENGYSGDPDRHVLWGRALANARNAGELLDLRDFVALTRVDYRNLDATRHRYAQAWGLFDFLSTNCAVQLRQYLREMNEKSVRGSVDRLAIFEHVFGPVESLKSPWEDYLNSNEQ